MTNIKNCGNCARWHYNCYSGQKNQPGYIRMGDCDWILPGNLLLPKCFHRNCFMKENCGQDCQYWAHEDNRMKLTKEEFNNCEIFKWSDGHIPVTG